MDYRKGADFCFTGFAVVLPVMAWSGNFEAGAVVCGLLLYITMLCGMMVEDSPDL